MDVHDAIRLSILKRLFVESEDEQEQRDNLELKAKAVTMRQRGRLDSRA